MWSADRALGIDEQALARPVRSTQSDGVVLAGQPSQEEAPVARPPGADRSKPGRSSSQAATAAGRGRPGSPIQPGTGRPRPQPRPSDSAIVGVLQPAVGVGDAMAEEGLDRVDPSGRAGHGHPGPCMAGASASGERSRSRVDVQRISQLQLTTLVGMRVLVVDDEPAVRQALDRALRFEGYTDRDGRGRHRRARSPTPSGRPTPSCSTSPCPGWTASRCAAGSGAPATRRRSCCSPPGPRSPTGWPASTPAPTTTWSSRSPSRSCWPGCGRCCAAARRFGDDEVLRFADLSLDPATREVQRGDRRIELTRTEFLLLELLLRNARQVLPREVIFDRVWGYDFGANSNSLEVYIGYLRRKTEADGEPRLLHTVRGVGYVLQGTARRLSGAEAGLQALAPDGASAPGSRSWPPPRWPWPWPWPPPPATSPSGVSSTTRSTRRCEHEADLVRNSQRPERGSSPPSRARRTCSAAESAGPLLIQIVRVDDVSPVRNGVPLPVSAADGQVQNGDRSDAIRTARGPGEIGPVRVVLHPGPDEPSGPGCCQLALPLHDINRHARQAGLHPVSGRRLPGWASPWSSATWWPGSSLAPVERLTGAAEHVAATQDLEATIEVDRRRRAGPAGRAASTPCSPPSPPRGASRPSWSPTPATSCAPRSPACGPTSRC